MIKSNKINGFTLAETVVALAISSMALYIFYFGLDLFTRMQSDIIETGVERIDEFQLYNELALDATKANDIYLEQGNVFLVQAKDTVSYEISDKHITKLVSNREGVKMKFANTQKIADVTLKTSKRGTQLSFYNRMPSLVISINNY